MSSFYGNGISVEKVTEMINTNINDIKNHIIFSKTEPTTQNIGDIWFVLNDDNENNNGN